MVQVSRIDELYAVLKISNLLLQAEIELQTG